VATSLSGFDAIITPKGKERYDAIEEREYLGGELLSERDFQDYALLGIVLEVGFVPDTIPLPVIQELLRKGYIEITGTLTTDEVQERILMEEV